MNGSNERTSNHIGENIPQIFGLEKVTGKAIYASDVTLPGMLYAAIKRSPMPHARIVGIDVSKASKLPGVVAIITANDVPRGLHGRGLLDTPILASGFVRYVGEPVAAVAADSYETALEAVELIEVELEELPAVFSVDESLKDNPPTVIHPKLNEYRRASSKLYRVKTLVSKPNVSAYQKIVLGDVEAAFRQADLIVEGKYSTSPVSHVQLEPTSIIAKMDNDGTLHVITSGQTPFRTRKELSDCLGIPEQKIRIIVPKNVGGGFGNRGAAVYEPLCAALAMHTNGRPVKLTLSRMEEFAASTSRHEAKIHIIDAVTNDARIIGRKITVVYNGGAYSVAGNVAVRNAVYAISSVYKIPNIFAEIYRVYTNRLQGGAFRGFGTTQVYWAIESHMDEIARKLKIDPIQLRKKNILKNGQKTCIGENLKDDTMDLCLEEFERKIRSKTLPQPPSSPSCRVGRGIAIAKHQCDVTYPNIAIVKINADSYVDLFVGSTDVGQGTFTGLAQIVADEFNISVNKVRIFASDTFVTPVATGSSGSRQLVQMGLAVAAACRDAKDKILKLAAKKLGISESSLYVSGAKIYSKNSNDVLITFDELLSPGPMGGDVFVEEGVIIGKGMFHSDVAELDPDTGQLSGDQAALDYTPVCASADVEVDIETGTLRVLDLLIVTDVGKAINPKLVEGQIHGGAWMGMSTTIWEFLFIENGRVLNPSLMDYLIASAAESPTVEAIALESGLGPGYAGSRSIGEIPILPIAPAIGNALADATGVRISDLPLTPEKVLNSLKYHK